MVKQMKIAITADVHAGVPGRLDDIIWACRTIREYCHVAGIDVVVVLGDLFHDRRSLEIEVISAMSKFFEDTVEKYNQQWVVFPGNHDMFLRHSWNVNSLTHLRKHLTVIEDVKLLMLDHRRFWVLPFIQYERSFMKVLWKIEDQHEDGDTLLTHIGVRGATLNTCFLLKDWSIINFDESKFQRIYTGHFHSKQNLDKKVFYPGSPIPFKFDEGDVPHGFYVHDLDDDSYKFINIWKAGNQLLPNERMPPQFCTFSDDSINNKTKDDVYNNIIRVSLQREYTLEEKRAIKDHLMQLGAVAIRWMNLTQQKSDKISEDIPQIGYSQRNFFRAWLEADKKGVKDLDLSVLERVHNDVVQEGDEIYAVEESDV